MSSFIEQLWDAYPKGVKGPCGFYHRIYRQPLTAIHGAMLIKLYKLAKGDTEKPFHVNQFSIGRHTHGRAWALARHWGLVSMVTNEDTKKRTSGLWTITEKGIRFVEHRCGIPSHIWVLDGEMLRYDYKNDPKKKYVSILDVLDTEFNYEKLMDGTL